MNTVRFYILSLYVLKVFAVMPVKVTCDVVLSSGFLAFARHAGFIDAAVDAGITPSRIIGTSSGSLAGSMWAAGMSPSEITIELKRKRPIELVRPSLKITRGAFSLRGLINHLRTILPKDFSQLQIPLAVGVFGESGRFELVSSGDLPDAVAASCSIPYLFQPVLLNGKYFADGGIKDRLGLHDWSQWSDNKQAIVHLVGTSRPKSQSTEIISIGGYESLDVPPSRDVYVIRTPKSKASFFSLRDFDAQKNEAYVLTTKTLLNSNYQLFTKKLGEPIGSVQSMF
jgi:hypothetical protein